MTKQIRVRFAPSPSGSLHIGGLRTALFNWAWAKKNNATFIVRVENTDAERSTPESQKIILDSLRWAGIDWNEGVEVGGDYGPYIQSERVDIYKHYAEKLISEGKAYRCYCTEDDLKAAREAWVKHNPKVGFKYPGTCKGKPYDAGKPHVIRLIATTEGTTEFTDKAYGKISTPNIENQDWVIMRTDGLPLYNWGCVLDDALMKVSLVGRGADHLANTVPQLLMYKALGFEPPEFCHLGLIRGKNNEKLSKRHASVAVFEYRDQGFSPSALLNYLARLGWGHGNAEVFSISEFIEMFDWSGCGKKDGKWDSDKLAAIQHEHLKQEKLTSNEEYAHRTLPFLYARGVEDVNHRRVEEVVSLIRHKCKTFIEAANELDPILRKDISMDPAAVEKFITPTSKQLLASFLDHLVSLDMLWCENYLRTATTTWLTLVGSTMKDIGQPLRVCLTGRANSPELFAVMGALGRGTTLQRIDRQVRG